MTPSCPWKWHTLIGVTLLAAMLIVLSVGSAPSASFLARSSAPTTSLAASELRIPVGSSSSTHPSSRYASGTAYDAKDGYVVMFGGKNLTTFFDDTWKYSGGVWTKLSPKTHPSVRGFPAMTYDAADGYVLLFGGYGPSGDLNDTWEFSAGQWTQLHPKSAPSVRFGASVSFDPAANYTLLFGGLDGVQNLSASKIYSDTWSYTAGEWTELHPVDHPSPRVGAGMTFDPKDGYLVLFGGCTGPVGFCQGPTSDTWTFSAGAWTNVTSADHPSPRGGMGMAYDAADGYVFLFGGADNTTTFNDSWTYLGGVWTELSPPKHPFGLVGVDFAYDSADQYILLFGGYHLPPKVKSDTWTYSDGTWTKV